MTNMVYLVNCYSTPFQRFDSLNANDHKIFCGIFGPTSYYAENNAIFTWVYIRGVEINQFKFVVGNNVTKKKERKKETTV